MDGECVRIGKATNGYTVEIKDPAIVRANNKRDSSKGIITPWKDPWRTFVFEDKADALKFLDKNLDKALKADGDDFGTAFDLAVAEKD